MQEELPFADESFDAYTIAFGIRNVPRIDAALTEAFRVLKRGGRFLCLEFSEVDMPRARPRLRGLFVQRDPARSASSVTGDSEPYRLSGRDRSANFPNQETFAGMMPQARLRPRVTYRSYSGGMARCFIPAGSFDAFRGHLLLI